MYHPPLQGNIFALFYRNASDVSELEGVIKSQVVETTFNLLVRRSHILEDCIRGTQKRLFSPEKSLVVSSYLRESIATDLEPCEL